MGYDDDGEEHIGVEDDGLDGELCQHIRKFNCFRCSDICFTLFYALLVKRKLMAAAEEGDSKSAKRARRLADDSAAATGQRKMDSFVRTGQSTVQRASTSRIDSRKFTQNCFHSTPRTARRDQ